MHTCGLYNTDTMPTTTHLCPRLAISSPLHYPIIILFSSIHRLDNHWRPIVHCHVLDLAALLIPLHHRCDDTAVTLRVDS